MHDFDFSTRIFIQILFLNFKFSAYLIRSSDGIQIHEKASGIQQFYSEDNRILKVVRVQEKALIVTDEMGSVTFKLYTIY